MKKLLTTALATVTALTIVGTPVFAAETTQDVTTQGGSVTVDVNYDCEYTSYDKNDAPDTVPEEIKNKFGDNTVKDVKDAFYVKVKSETTNGKIKVNHSYNQTNGVWSAVDTVYDKTAGKAKFTVTNYSAKDVRAAVSFAPKTTIAKAITTFNIDVATAFASTFGSTTFDVPTSYNSESAERNVEFLDDVKASDLTSGTNVVNMGTFTVTVSPKQ